MTSARTIIWRSVVMWILSGLSMVLPLSTRAHGPFDNSAQAIVHDETVEVMVTMGMEGARQFLLQAGLSEGEVTTTLAGRGPATAVALKESLAPRFFEASAFGNALVAQSVAVTTDGLEAAFTIVYSRPRTEGVRLRARYFDGIELMKPGSFIVTDENRNTLGGGRLTRANATVDVKFPPAQGVSPAPATGQRADPHQSPVANQAIKTDTSVAMSSRRHTPRVSVWIAVFVVVVVLLRGVARKLAQ